MHPSCRNWACCSVSLPPYNPSINTSPFRKSGSSFTKDLIAWQLLQVRSWTGKCFITHRQYLLTAFANVKTLPTYYKWIVLHFDIRKLWRGFWGQHSQNANIPFFLYQEAGKKEEKYETFRSVLHLWSMCLEISSPKEEAEEWGAWSPLNGKETEISELAEHMVSVKLNPSSALRWSVKFWYLVSTGCARHLVVSWQHRPVSPQISPGLDLSLSNPRELVTDREVWCAAVHGVAKSRIRLSDWTELGLEPNNLRYAGDSTLMAEGKWN